MTTETPTPEQQAEDKLMDAVRANAATNPESIPAQFGGDVEKYITSYKELQKKMTQQAQELSGFRKAAETPAPIADPNKPPATPKPLEITEPPVVETPVFDWDAATEEFNSTGDISDASKAKLIADLKIKDPRFVDHFVGFMKQQRASAQAKAMEVAGGVEQYNAVLEWAHGAFNETERAALNTSLKSPMWELAWMGLVTKYQAANKSSANTMLSGSPGNNTTDIQPYRTHKEMMKDLADPRYRSGSDPDFINHVQRRAAKSPQFSN